MRVELRHLRVVCAIADAGSVTKAAASLGLAAPALTTQLQRIERTLGGQLFHRDRTGARPTELGELVLARARVLLPDAQSLEDEAIGFAASLGRTDRPAAYRIGAAVGPLGSGLVSRLASVRPGTRLRTHPPWSIVELENMLLEDRLDFAVVGRCGEPGGSPLSARLTWRLIANAPVFVLLAEAHPLAGAEEIELARLAESRWAATSAEGCFAECFATACARSGFTPRPILETDANGCADLVRSGAAVALCQPTFRESPGIAVVPLAGTPMRWRHLIGWRPGSSAAYAAEQVIRQAEDAYADAVGRSRTYVRWLHRHAP